MMTEMSGTHCAITVVVATSCKSTTEPSLLPLQHYQSLGCLFGRGTTRSGSNCTSPTPTKMGLSGTFSGIGQLLRTLARRRLGYESPSRRVVINFVCGSQRECFF